MLLQIVTSEQAKQTTADYVAVGRQLLTLFFVIWSENCSREAVQSTTGDRLAYQQNKKRTKKGGRATPLGC